MKTMFFLLLLNLAVAEAFGQAQIIKQRAKELSEQNNARQGIAPNPQRAPMRPAVAVAPGPFQPMVASPEILRQYDLNMLKADLAEMKPGVAATPELIQRLTKNLSTALRGTSKASAKTIRKLADDLGAALFQASLTEANQALIAEDLVSILNGGGGPAKPTQETVTSIQATLQRGGVERKLAVAVATDLKLIGAEMQKGGAR